MVSIQSFRAGRYTRSSRPLNSPASAIDATTRSACPTRSGSSVQMMIPAWSGIRRCKRLKSRRLIVSSVRPIWVALASKSSSGIDRLALPSSNAVSTHGPAGAVPRLRVKENSRLHKAPSIIVFLVCFDLGVYLRAVRANEVPGIRQIPHSQGGIVSEEVSFAGAKTPRLFQEPNGDSSARDASHTTHNTGLAFYSGKVVATISH